MKNQEKESNPFLLYYGINLPHPYRTESSGLGYATYKAWKATWKAIEIVFWFVNPQQD